MIGGRVGTSDFEHNQRRVDYAPRFHKNTERRFCRHPAKSRL